MTVILIVKIVEYFQLPSITAKFPRQFLRHWALEKVYTGKQSCEGKLARSVELTGSKNLLQ
jgi:hypothetical protein